MAVLAFGAMGAWLAPVGYAATGFMAGMAVYNALFPEDLPEVRSEGPRLEDKRILSSAYGNFITIIKGRARAAGEVIWAQEIEEHDHTTVTEQGGKGGPSQTTTQITHTWTVNIAIALCKGTAAGFRMVWKGGEVAFNAGVGASPMSVIASNALWASARFYSGDETQEPDTFIESIEGTGNVSAYRGTAYLMIEGMNLPNGSLENLEFEVIEKGAEGPSYKVHEYGGPQSIWSLPSRSEVWIAYNSGVEGVGASYAIHDMVADTHTVFEHPGSDIARQPCINEVAGLLFTSPGSGDAIVMDIETHTLLANFGDTLDGRLGSPWSAAWVIGGNATHIIYAISSIIGLGFVEVRIEAWTGNTIESGGSTLGVTPSLSATEITDAGVLTTQFSLCDSSGRWWWVGTRTLYSASDGDGVEAREFMGDADAYGNAFVAPTYDPKRHAICLIVRAGELITPPLGTAYIVRYAITSQAWSVVGPVAETIKGTPMTLAYDSDRDMFAVTHKNQKIVRYNAASGALIDTLTISSAGFPVADIAIGEGLSQWDTTLCRTSVIHGGLSFTQAGLGTLELRYNTMIPADRVLGDVVEELCQLSDLSVGQVHAEALTTMVHGYKIGRLGTTRAAIEVLREAYGFDMVERFDGLHWIPRGGAVAVVIPQADLAARSYGEDMPAVVAGTEALESDRPCEVRVHHLDSDNAYQPNVQPARRQVTSSDTDIDIDFPIVFTPNEAQGVAQRILFERAAGSGLREFSTTMKYDYLEPTDVVQLLDGSLVHTVRIDTRTESAGLLTFKGITEVSAVHAQDGVGAGYVSTATQVPVPGNAKLYPLDIPLLRDVDDGPGWYATATGTFKAAYLWKSIDGGANYGASATYFSAPAARGLAISALPNFLGGNTLDSLSTVDIVLPVGTLASVSDVQMFAGANTFYIAGEIVQAAICTLIAAQTYRLSRLRRARHGTAQFMATHRVGDLFFVLSTSTLRDVGESIAESGVERYYKLPAAGQLLSPALAQAFTNTNVRLKPLAPAHLRAGITADASYDIVTAWNRRTRLSGSWRNLVDVPLGETTESYSVVIYSDQTFATVVRTTVVATPTLTYTNAQQVSDFGETRDRLHWSVRQVSAAVGLGFPTYVTTQVAAIVTAHRYWRVCAVDLPGAFLEISELQFLENHVDLTSTATKTSNATPTGTFSDLFDGNLSTAPSWTAAVVGASSFYIAMDFGTAKSINGVKQGGYNDATRIMRGFTLQFSDNAVVWSTYRVFTGLEYPGYITLSEEIGPIHLMGAAVAASTATGSLPTPPPIQVAGAAVAAVSAAGTLTIGSGLMGDAAAEATAAGEAVFMLATGGTITDYGDIRVHVFTSAAVDFEVLVPGNGLIEILIVGGGGGGGSAEAGYGGGGGGGGGQVVYDAAYAVTTGVYTVAVGDGGFGGVNPGGDAGQDSNFDGGLLSAVGGAGGAGFGMDNPIGIAGASSGASGGGGGSGDELGGSGVYNGGAGVILTGGGGGGSTGGPGADAGAGTGGAGGNSTLVVTPDGSFSYGGGGGGGAADSMTGGYGPGGGDGGSPGSNGANATQYGGGGGGAGADGSTGGNGGTGSPGVIIIWYRF